MITQIGTRVVPLTLELALEFATMPAWRGERPLNPKRVEYLYITAAGGHAIGHMAPEADALAFPAAKLVTPTRSIGFRSRLKRVGEDGYEVFREYETEKGWAPVTVQMRKVPR